MHTKTNINGWIKRGGMISPKSSGARRWLKWTCQVLLIGGAVMCMGGCAAELDSGYAGSYYNPGYGSYYGSYGYAGDPFPFLGGTDIIVGGGRHYHRHYGYHHFHGQRYGRRHFGGHHFGGHRFGGHRGGGRHFGGHHR
ncbi:MAG: hypothetical protein INR62_01540 [Rhodospirillales bacterium]|nr:hypothetical protein [Acetobacter sp.]